MSEKIVIRETCKFCAKSYPFSPEHFSMCNECHSIYCSDKCVIECQCGWNVCPICEEEIRRKYRTVGLKCTKCAQNQIKIDKKEV